MNASDHQKIRELFDGYLRLYASRDDRLTAWFSDNFSGFAGGGHVLVKTREEWVAVTRQDFAQVKESIRIELKDLCIQSLSGTVAIATAFFNIHLPIQESFLSRETARLVLVFRQEGDWKICHSSISIPYGLVREGEVYPLHELVERTQMLEAMVAERTMELEAKNLKLAEAMASIRTLKGLVPICAACKKIRDDAGFWHHVETYVHDHTEAEFSHGLCPDCIPKYFPNGPEAGDPS
jgi:ketosteroid isomerase-like protein